MALTATGVCRGDAIDNGVLTAGLMDGARANGLGLRDTTRNTEAADGGAVAAAALAASTGRVAPLRVGMATGMAGLMDGARANGLIFGLGVESSTTVAD